MTTIAAVRKDGIAAIAADGQVSQGGTVVPGTMRAGPSKIHAVANGYVGVSGSVAHHSVLRSLWHRHPELSISNPPTQCLRRFAPFNLSCATITSSKRAKTMMTKSASRIRCPAIISPAGIFVLQLPRNF